MYVTDKKPVSLNELDWSEFIKLQTDKTNGKPLVKIPLSMKTPHIQKDFNLDLIIWNLFENNMEITQKTVHYVLNNFNKLFETGWTLLYYHLCNVEPYPDVAKHTLSEFYSEQIDFSSPYYSIQLEINSEHLADGTARYCFTVSTVCGYDKWMISGDDMRVYMVDNKCRGFETNNDDMQMLEYGMSELYGDAESFQEEYKRMEQEGFQYAESFQEFEYPVK